MSDLLTLVEAARLIERFPGSLRHKIRSGALTPVELDPVRVRKDDVLALTWVPKRTGPKPRVTPQRLPLVPRDASRRVLSAPDLSRGACRGTDQEMWFSDDTEVQRECSAICLGCPVFSRCREWALQREEFGFHGGMSAKQRADWRRMNGVTVTGSVVIRL